METWEDKLRKIMLEQEEEGDELFLVLVPTLQFCLYNEKMPEHTSSLSGAQKITEILEVHKNWCKVEFRMEPEIFRTTTHYLRVNNLLHDTCGVEVEEQLGMYLILDTTSTTSTTE
jgi:hypothetical protein